MAKLGGYQYQISKLVKEGYGPAISLEQDKDRYPDDISFQNAAKSVINKYYSSQLNYKGKNKKKDTINIKDTFEKGEEYDFSYLDDDFIDFEWETVNKHQNAINDKKGRKNEFK